MGRLAFGRYDVVHAVEEAAHLVAPFARLLGVPLVMDVDSSIPDQLRYSGFATRDRCLARRGAREPRAAARGRGRDGLRELTDGVKRRAPGVAVFQVEDPPLVDRRSRRRRRRRGAAP